MTLKIVWRNPASLPVTKRPVEQILTDDYRAVYEVYSADETTLFELVLPGAA
jgi:hypothetical protein